MAKNTQYAILYCDNNLSLTPALDFLWVELDQIKHMVWEVLYCCFKILPISATDKERMKIHFFNNILNQSANRMNSHFYVADVWNM